jgi:lauroyl/myristoyl acyltransferase
MERDSARAVMEILLAGTPREPELDELARAHFVERTVDRALFWHRPWSLELDASARTALQRAFSSGRGVLLSACHVGPYYRLQSSPLLRGEDTYLVPGAWFFEQPSRNYWGRRLARWRRGATQRLVPADGSFTIVQALLERGDHAFVFFDMPGPHQTQFLGKPASLANGTAHLAVLGDALVLPLRTRRAGHRAVADVGAALDPRDFAGADQLHEELAGVHERWILENPAEMHDPRDFGWDEGATPAGWHAPAVAAV